MVESYAAAVQILLMTNWRWPLVVLVVSGVVFGVALKRRDRVLGIIAVLLAVVGMAIMSPTAPVAATGADAFSAVVIMLVLVWLICCGIAAFVTRRSR